MGDASETGLMTRQIASQTTEAPTNTPREDTDKSSGETTEAMAGAFEEVISEGREAEESEAKKKELAKERQKKAQSRLESLTKMFLSNKSSRSDEEGGKE